MCMYVHVCVCVCVCACAHVGVCVCKEDCIALPCLVSEQRSVQDGSHFANEEFDMLSC